MQYRVAQDVLAASVADETVLLDMRSKNYFRLNGTAARIWNALERGCTVPEVVDELHGAFAAEREVVETETLRLVEALRERGLVEAGPR